MYTAQRNYFAVYIILNPQYNRGYWCIFLTL
jgi:hypothetical protein